MKIYFGHSKDFDYVNEYYIPIEKNTILQNETLIFPHKDSTSNKHERDFYTNLDLFIAEVSYRATGLGIELGWASDDNIPIYCFYKTGTKPNSSLRTITDHIIEYNSSEDLSNKIEQIVIEHQKTKEYQRVKTL